jgi:hypothetical protein
MISFLARRRRQQYLLLPFSRFRDRFGVEIADIARWPPRAENFELPWRGYCWKNKNTKSKYFWIERA